ncbi:T9SS type A sorting domain-containing protein [Paraflavitalea soli]|nr:T9SS type A sorting domain-containing protein [Paraflavitalea soli]
MNKHFFPLGHVGAWLLVATCLGGASTAAAQQLTIYGKFDWGSAAIAGGVTSATMAKSSYTNAAILGNLVQGSYRITSATSTANIVPGMELSGTGIPTHAVVVDVTGSTISMSKPVAAASATGVSITAATENATLVTAHANGLGGSLPGFATYVLDSGIHYAFNGPTSVPFPAQANGAADRIYAGNLLINASVDLNKKLQVANILTLTAGKLTIPAGDSLLITSGLAIAGAPFGADKYIVTGADTTSGAEGFLAVNNISGAYLFPVGSADQYLPVTLLPSSNDAFAVGAFEGITGDAQPDGAAFTATAKEKVVDAVWTIVRTCSNTDSCLITLAWPNDLEGNAFSSDDSIGIMAYDTAWMAAAGTGDNTLNTASHRFSQFLAFAVGRRNTTAGRGSVKKPGKGEEGAPKVDKDKKGPVVKLYPNPATGQLFIEHTLQAQPLIVLYDAAGRVVGRQYATAARTIIPIAVLLPGIYTITISDGAHTIMRKFVKQ